MARTGIARVMFVVGTAMALASLYGWWFHASAGPAHGAGFELGAVAGVLSAGAFGAWWRLRRRRGP